MKKRVQKMNAPRTLTAIVKAPGDKPRVTVIANTLEAMQSIVGGHIEIAGFMDECVVICNEEGRLLGLPTNIMGIWGTFIVLGRGNGDGEFASVENAKEMCILLGSPEERA